MKRLLILSLLMIQGVWGANAAGNDGGAPAQNAQQTVIVTTSDDVNIEYQYPGWSNQINNFVYAFNFSSLKNN
jgi:hypothetical protein